MNIIKRQNILLAEIVQFKSIKYDTYLVHKHLSDEDKYHPILFIDHNFIDLITLEEIDYAIDDYGNAKGEILINTNYIQELYNYNKPITDEDLLHIGNIYQEYLRRKKLYQEKKLIKFPQKRLY